MVLQAEHTEQSGMWDTFLLSHLLIKVEFELDASCSFINVSCVISLGIEVEAKKKKPQNMRKFFPRMQGEI